MLWFSSVLLSYAHLFLLVCQACTLPLCLFKIFTAHPFFGNFLPTSGIFHPLHLASPSFTLWGVIVLLRPLLLVQEGKWGTRGWSHSRAQVSPWGSCWLRVLGLTQKTIQEQAIVEWRKAYSGRYTLRRQTLGHLRRQERPQGIELSVFIRVDNFIG